MQRIVIIKPSNGIHLCNRDDSSKTDIQSAEIIGFINAIQKIPEVSLLANIQIVTDSDESNSLNNSNTQYSNVKSITYQKLQQECVFNNANIVYNSCDVLIVFCGLWLDTEQNDFYVDFIKSWPGKAYYIMNDIRLNLPKYLVGHIDIVSQALNVNSKYDRIALEMLPYFMNYDAADTASHNTFDISYSFVNTKDLDEFRRSELFKLADNANIDKYLIGPANEFKRSRHCTLTDTVKSTSMIKHLSKCKSTYVVSQQKYIQHNLMPNRLVEGLIAKTGLVINRHTYESFIDDNIDLAKFCVTVDSADTITTEHCNKALELVQSNYSIVNLLLQQKAYKLVKQLEKLLYDNK